MFRFPRFRYQLIRKEDLAAQREALSAANAELQKCVSTLFEQRRSYETKLAHLAELLQGSECEIGGIVLKYRRDI